MQDKAWHIHPNRTILEKQGFNRLTSFFVYDNLSIKNLDDFGAKFS